MKEITLHSMSRRKYFLFGITCCIVLASVGLGAKTWLVPDTDVVSLTPPEQLTLFSIDGTQGFAERPPPPERFHGYPVLGQIDIGDAEKRMEVLYALKQGIKEENVRLPCWRPRHGLRVVQKGRQRDYVICFECGRLVFIAPWTENQGLSITVSGRDLLNQLLQDAGVPLAGTSPSHQQGSEKPSAKVP
jgi:hypothetical protein